MINETPRISEIKTNEGTAFVFRDALSNLDNSDLRNRIQALGFDPSLFKNLITLNYEKWTGEPIESDYPSDQPVEHIVIRTTKIEDGKEIEVTEVTTYAPHTMKARLKKTPPDKSIGFEAILLKEGAITYDILHGFEPAAEDVYIGSEDHTSIELKPGDLLIIPRPVARKITEVENGSKSVYLSDPWEHDEPHDIL